MISKKIHFWKKSFQFGRYFYRSSEITIVQVAEEKIEFDVVIDEKSFYSKVAQLLITINCFIQHTAGLSL